MTDSGSDSLLTLLTKPASLKACKAQLGDLETRLCSTIESTARGDVVHESGSRMAATRIAVETPVAIIVCYNSLSYDLMCNLIECSACIWLL